MSLASFIERLIDGHVLFFVLLLDGSVLWSVAGEVLHRQDLVAVVWGAGGDGTPVGVPVLVPRRVLEDRLRLFRRRRLGYLVLEIKISAGDYLLRK